MVDLQGHEEVLRGAKLSKRWQKYFDKCNRLYFDSRLPEVRVYTAPLLKITQLSQKTVQSLKSWEHAGNYALAGYDENDEPCIILDKGTAVFHPVLTAQSVLHESIHFYLGLEIKSHGKIFKAQIRRIASLGALDDLI
jgi:hypothetical protein